MALILHRVMRMRLKAGDSGISPERALQLLRLIQHHRVSIRGAEPVSGVSSVDKEVAVVLKDLKVKQPSQNQQLSLLYGHALNSHSIKSKTCVINCRTRGGKYTLEFKLEAVRLVNAGQSSSMTAKILGIPNQTLDKQMRCH